MKTQIKKKLFVNIVCDVKHKPESDNIHIDNKAKYW